MADYYIREGGSGDGSQGNPWGDFTALNALTLSGDTVHIAGTIRDELNLVAASGSTITQWVGESSAMILGSTLLTSGWTSAGATYTRSAAAVTAYYLDNAGTITPLVEQTSLANCQATDYSTFYDGAGTVHVRLDGSDPNGQSIERTDRSFCIRLGNSTNCTVEQMDCRFAESTPYSFDTGLSGLVCQDNYSMGSGGWNTSTAVGQQCYNFKGYSGLGGTASTGVIVRRNTGNDAQNNFMEFGGLDGALVEDNAGHSCEMGIELWNECVNSTFRRNKLTNIVENGTVGVNGHGNGLWLAADTQSVGFTGGNSGNAFSENVFESEKNYAVDIGNSCLNNTLSRNSINHTGTSGSPLIIRGNATGTVDSNLFAVTSTHRRVLETQAGTTVSFVDNVYWTANNNGATFIYAGTTYDNASNKQTSFASFVGASGDAGAMAEVLWRDYANGDYRLSGASQGKDGGAVTGGVDLLGNPYKSSPSYGAYQFRGDNMPTDIGYRPALSVTTSKSISADQSRSTRLGSSGDTYVALANEELTRLGFTITDAVNAPTNVSVALYEVSGTTLGALASAVYEIAISTDPGGTPTEFTTDALSVALTEGTEYAVNVQVEESGISFVDDSGTTGTNGRQITGQAYPTALADPWGSVGGDTSINRHHALWGTVEAVSSGGGSITGTITSTIL